MSGRDGQGANPEDSLGLFFAHAITLELEAAERLHELAAALEVHHNQPLSRLLAELAEHSEVHAQEVRALGRDLTLPALKAWEYAWPGAESPEAVGYADVHYLMTPREALQAALRVEQQAEAFYRDIAARAQDEQVGRYAAQFADEEQTHVALVQARLDVLPDTGEARGDRKVDFDPPNMPE